MGYKKFILDTKDALESRLDYIVPRWEDRVKRRSAFTKLMKPGLAKDWRAQYENHPTKYRKPDGL